MVKDDGRMSPNSVLTVAHEDQRERDIALLRSFLQSNSTVAASWIERANSETDKPPLNPFAAKQHRTPPKNCTKDGVGVVERPLKPGLNRALSRLRSIIVDLPLSVLCLAFCCTCFLTHIHHSYHVPMFNAAIRVADDKALYEDYTYYDRECTLQDLTSTQGEGLLLNANATARQAVDNIMLHGISVIPSILNQDTMEELRSHILNRNKGLTRAEKIPLTNNHHRASFAIDVMEHPTIAKALKQIADHELLRNTLRGLVGEDPALTEITAITSTKGAVDQSWHCDVKADGNALKFARTYSHSYSLFIPLQDTTEAMGATTVCPGTHYCASDAYDMCTREGYALTRGLPDGLWRAGDGTLLNQQVWHRGGGHAGGPPRVVFIVSFIGRPDDTRQLQRGTYFHIKWNMWGHTLRDLADAHVSMSKPFSILRSFNVWKPPNRNMGYDYISSVIMRIANEQMGVGTHDLRLVKKHVVDKILPEFLQGKIKKKSLHPWKDYFQETLLYVHYFVGGIHAAVLLFYLIGIGMLSTGLQSWYPARSAMNRLVVTHGIPILLLWGGMRYVATSPWGIRVRGGNFCRPPFANLAGTGGPSSAGRTTMPTRHDILVGTRYDAAHLGAYERWLDFHPGNRDFQERLQRCSAVPSPVRAACLDETVSSNPDARILLQDWRTGDWMHHENPRQHVWDEFKLLQSPKFRDTVIKSIRRLIAHYRFDVPHRVTMNRITVEVLEKYKDRLLHANDDDVAVLSDARRMLVKSKPMLQQRPTRRLGRASNELIFTMLSKSRRPRPMLIIESSLPQQPVTGSTTAQQAVATPSHARWTTSPKPRFAKGDLVVAQYEDDEDYYPGVVHRVDDETGLVDIAYNDGEWAYGLDPHRQVYKDLPLEEGARVKFVRKEGDDDEKDVVKAEVTRIHANGRVDLNVWEEDASYRHVHPDRLIRLEGL